MRGVARLPSIERPTLVDGDDRDDAQRVHGCPGRRRGPAQLPDRPASAFGIADPERAPCTDNRAELPDGDGAARPAGGAVGISPVPGSITGRTADGTASRARRRRPRPIRLAAAIRLGGPPRVSNGHASFGPWLAPGDTDRPPGAGAGAAARCADHRRDRQGASRADERAAFPGRRRPRCGRRGPGSPSPGTVMTMAGRQRTQRTQATHTTAISASGPILTGTVPGTPDRRRKAPPPIDVSASETMAGDPVHGPDPDRRNHPDQPDEMTTDQKVGGSSPSERANP